MNKALCIFACLMLLMNLAGCASAPPDEAQGMASCAAELTRGKGPIKPPFYAISVPKSDNPVDDLAVKAYQKFLEGPFWGESDSTQRIKAIQQRYGQGHVLVCRGRICRMDGKGQICRY